MRKYFFFIFLILACKMVYSGDYCPSDKVYKDTQCITNEECCEGGGLLLINLDERNCIDFCPMTQYIEESNNLKTCKFCPDETPIPKSDQSGCELCSSPQIADISSHTCLEDASKCTDILQKDGVRCGPNCGPSEFQQKKQELTYCQDQCDAFQALDGINCQDTCPLSDSTVPPLSPGGPFKCLTAYSQCTTGVINEQKDYCQEECPIHFAPLQKDNYRQCEKCDYPKALYQKIQNVQKCVYYCEEALIQDTNSMICIDRRDCTRYLSSDYQCSDGCKPNEVVYNQGDPYKICQSQCNSFTYSNGVDINCVSSCPEGMITDTANKKCVSSKTDCDFAVSLDGKNCVTSCDLSKREIFVNKECAICDQYISTNDYSCVNACPSNQTIDSEKKMCYATKEECTSMISSDGQSCLNSCNPDEKEVKVLSSDKKYYQCAVCNKQYFIAASQAFPDNQCLDICPQNYISEPTTHSCLQNLTDCTSFVSVDQLICIASCDSANKQYPDTLTVESKTYKQCKVCEKYFFEVGGQDASCLDECANGTITDEANKKCYSAPALCSLVVSADGANCIASCDQSKKEIQQQQNGYQKCIICDKYFTESSGSVASTCTAACAKGKTQDETEKVCLAPLSECKTYISSDSKKCVKTCNSLKKEFVRTVSGQNKCQTCPDFYTANADIMKSTCKTTCDQTNQLLIIPTGTCVEKTDICTDGLIMSSDKTSCDKQCNFPDIQQDSTCIAESSCIGENLIIDETSSKIICASTSGNYSCTLKSSDGKRCVKTCVSIKEAEPAEGKSQCQTCESPQQFYVILKDTALTGGCKEVISAEDQKTLLEKQLSNLLQTAQELKSIKQSLSDYIETLAISITDSSDNLQKISSIENYAEKLLTKLQTESADTFTGIKYVPQSIGHNASVKVVFQAAKSGKKLRNIINIKEVASDSSSDLTEDNFDGAASNQGIIYSIINKNPGCQTTNCKDFPAVKLKIIESFIPLRRILVDQTFQMDFPVTQGQQNYVCLNYNLQTNQASSTTSATLSSDGTTARCQLSFSESTSLYLDTTCLYLDKSKCPSFSDNNGIGTWEIVGIVIGSVAFAGIIGVSCFYLYKNLFKKKKAMTKYKSPQGIETI